jgi:hypothetical protein
MKQKILILPLLGVLLACNDSASPPAPEFSVDIRTLDKFDQESQEFAQGEEINIELSITNLTSDDKSFMVGFPEADLNLIDDTGEIVWTWSNGKLDLLLIFGIQLKANETRTRKFDWNQAINTGTGGNEGITTVGNEAITTGGDLVVARVAVGNYVLEGWFVWAPEEIASTTISIL